MSNLGQYPEDHSSEISASRLKISAISSIVCATALGLLAQRYAGPHAIEGGVAVGGVVGVGVGMLISNVAEKLDVFLDKFMQIPAGD